MFQFSSLKTKMTERLSGSQLQIIGLGALLALSPTIMTSCGISLSGSLNRAPASGAPAPSEGDQGSKDQDQRQDRDQDSSNNDVPQVGNEDSSCRKLPASLRNLYYSHYEKMADGKDIRYRTDLANKMAKLLGMTMKESSGNPASVTDMKLRGSSTSVKVFFRENSQHGVGSSGHLKISIEARNRLLNQGGVTMNKQTNFGLLQMSADRLYTQKNRDLYKTYKNVILQSPSKGVAYCGSEHVIRGSKSAIQAALKEAASCQEGYNSTSGVKCFGKLVTICPALNVQLGLNAPAAYFATRKAAPRCTSAFTFLAKSM